jgi:hypothetical protein
MVASWLKVGGPLEWKAQKWWRIDLITSDTEGQFPKVWTSIIFAVYVVASILGI